MGILLLSPPILLLNYWQLNIHATKLYKIKVFSKNSILAILGKTRNLLVLQHSFRKLLANFNSQSLVSPNSNLKHKTIIRTVRTCNKILCYVPNSASRLRIVINAKMF